MLLGLYTGARSYVVVLKDRFTDKLSEEQGAGMVEYALLIVGIGIVLVGAMVFLSGRIGGGLSKAGNSIGT